MNFGIAKTDITYESEINNEKKKGVKIDFNYIRKISPYFYIGTGLGFIQNGDKYDFFMTNENGEAVGVEKVKQEFNYVNLPIYFGIKYGKNFYFFTDIGVLPAVLIQSEVKSDLQQWNTNLYDQVDKFDVSGKIRIGVGKHFSDKISSDLNIGYQKSLKRIDLNSDKLRHVGFLINIGISYKLSGIKDGH
ncbi:outer membrane beta-barrel protein [Fulvivirga sediminis]|uniref:Outer membrane protein beta-barrel domain-containing protein n=1 Tax=Fulvivirga sediminis TaxID=2803949 RepID=A0A937F9T7_9BACT|nr:outer membrane beta-barrel protein [Fulvivirga sediminis]MBL3657637.1 hypothetical protein [Fulvivirga sediminis]